MVAATWRSFVGVGKEVTAGTGVVPTHFVPLTDDPEFADTIEYLHDEGIRGSAVKTYGVVPGPKNGEFTLKGNVDLKSIGFPLASVLPDITTTGAAAPFTHAFSLLNTGTGQPKGYSYTDFQGVQARRFEFSVCEELNFTFDSEGLLEFEASHLSQASATVATPSPSYSTYNVLPNFKACVTIGGTQSLEVQEGEVNISREVELIRTLNCGNSDPYSIFTGVMTVEGKLTFVMEDEDELLRYLNNTQPSLDILLEHTAAADSIRLNMNKVAYTTGAVKRGEEFVQIEVEFVAIANSTNAGASGGLSPIKVTILNGDASGTYA